ncbi:AAA family ATPase [Ruegeria sp. SCPT10]|uniref:AAA family ATPase n=1 Tax=Ruegeria sp. SCP10 TaxID=3141377 RepID=UPI00333BABCF
MTVLFVDLVGSTDATQHFGSEAMFEVIQSFQSQCQQEIQSAGGFVAKYLGDGAMAYFGYPRSIKNSAATAVACAIKIIEIASALKIKGKLLQACCGIATGWSVVNIVRAGEAAQEALAIGNAVNRAARLQSLASPSSIFFSSEVRRSIDQAALNLREVGETALKGFRNPIDVWAIDVPHLTGDQAMLATGSILNDQQGFQDQPALWDGQVELNPVGQPMLGRSDLMSQISTCYADAASGRFVFADVMAPGGYGKTMLAEQFLASVPDANVIRVVGSLHRSEQSFACFNAAIRTLIAQEQNGTDPAASLEEWAPEGMLDGLQRLLNMSQIPVAPIVRQGRITEALQAILERELAKGPLILFIDDAQWLDEDSVAFLTLLSQVFRNQPLFLLATHRLEGRNLQVEADLRIDLTPLADHDAGRLIGFLDPDTRLNQSTRDKIIERANGIPLYVYHYTMTLLEQPQASIEAAIPQTLIEALQQRLDVDEDERQLVEVVAVLQDYATTDVAAAMMNQPLHEVQKTTDTLVYRSLLQQRGANELAFDHALLRDAVVTSMLNTRARKLHRDALQAYRAISPESLVANPIIEAKHLMGCEDYAQAIPKLDEAAQVATMRGEIAESVRVIKIAKGLLDKINDRDLHDRLELSTEVALGNALVQQEGFGSPRVAAAYGNAQTLCEAIAGGGEIEFQIAWGIWTHLETVSDVSGAARMVDRMERIAMTEPRLEVVSSSARSVLCFNMGEFAGQEAAYRRTKELYDFERHSSQAMTYSMDFLELANLFRAHGRFMAGDADGWEQTIASTHSHRERLGIPPLEPYIRIFGTASRCYAPSSVPIQEELKSARGLAETFGQPFWIVGANLWLSASRYHNESPAAALSELEAAVGEARALGIEIFTRYHEALLAHAYACVGRHEDAEGLWATIDTPENAQGNTMIWPEILRLRAESRYLAKAPADVLVRDLDHAEQMARDIRSLAWLAHILNSRRRLQLSSSEEVLSAIQEIMPSGAERHPSFKLLLE